MQLRIEPRRTDSYSLGKLLFPVARTLGVAVSLLFYAAKAEPQALQSSLVEHVVRGNISGAMRDVETILADYNRILESKKSGAWHGNDQFSVFYYELAQAQLLAMTQQKMKALQLLSDADRREALYFGRGKGGVLDQPWEDLVTATRGFILERSSDTAAAKIVYINAAPSNTYARGRLAVLYLNEGENTAAKSTAETLLRASPSDVNALFVLATLAGRRGDSRAAVRLCRQALIELGPKRRALNTFIPVYFAEGPRITASCGAGTNAH